jgi:transcriptional regulator with GAF, ATPase, and Fis domain
MSKDQNKTQTKLKDRLRFERLLAQLSARFINLPSGEVDSAIEDSLRCIVEEVGIDRSGLFQLDEKNDLVMTHTWCRPDVQPIPPRIAARENFPWMLQKILRNEPICFSSVSELPPEASRDIETVRRVGPKSNMSFPLSAGGRVFGAMTFGVLREERKWPEELFKRLRLLAEIFSNAIQRKQTEEELRTAYIEIKQLKDRLEAENIYLRQEIETALGFDTIVGKSDTLKYVLYRVGQFAPTDTTVLIMGETGTGKGLIARAIHSFSKRKDRPMIHVNCAALPANLIESELFGREKGAFTGAQEKQIGRFELAHKGTIFLDEIGELPMELQSKLLRILEDGAFERLGSPHTIKVDVRVIASTNRDLEEEVRNGRFREDLFYRLNVLPMTVPPLRQRRDDIPLLVESFVGKFNKKFGKHITSVPQDIMSALQSYPWHGNVRELMNVVERAVITGRNSVLHIAEKVDATLPSPQEATNKSLEATEREHILKVLKETGWKVEGPKGTALILGINPSTLRTRMKKLGIQRPTPR